VAPESPLVIAESRGEDELRLSVTGELDLASAPSLLDRLDEVDAGGTLAIDLGGVTFIDVAGVRVLLEAARRAHARRTRFVIYNPRRIASRVFGLTAVDQQLEIRFDDPSGA
jgi:anti-sigma B factor antagonist